MNEFIQCCDCSKDIPKENTKDFGFKDIDIICGSCIKKQYGEDHYNFCKSLVFDEDKK